MVNNNDVVEITSDPKSFYFEYLSIKKPVFETMLSMVHKKSIHLHPKVLQVFALLLYYNYKYRDIGEEQRWRLIFDYDTKVLIMNEVGISKAHLNTYMSLLRKLRLVVGKQVNPHFIFYPESEFELVFHFNIKDINEEQPH